MGLTPSLFAALTNAPFPDASATRSRGFLVRDVLACASDAEAARWIEEAVARDRYDGFNLLLAGARDARLASWSADGLAWRDVGFGSHVVQHRAGGLVEGPPLPPGDDDEARLREFAASTLASHSSLDAIGHPPCRHEGERGTVATMLASFHADRPQDSFLLFSRGPACQAKFEAGAVSSP